MVELRGWLSGAADLLLGASCPGCEGASWGICAACRERVSARPSQLTRPDPCPAGFPITAAATPYDGIVRKLITAHKEHQALTLTPFLASRLASAVDCLLDALSLTSEDGSPAVLVPVPSSSAAVRERGFDATWALTRQAARTLRPVHAVGVRRLLVQSRTLRDQAGLSAVARRENLSGGFRVLHRPLPPGAAVVLVDDVVTTGSSLTEAARALTAVGIPVLGAAAIAATVRSRAARSTHAQEIR